MMPIDEPESFALDATGVIVCPDQAAVKRPALLTAGMSKTTPDAIRSRFRTGKTRFEAVSRQRPLISNCGSILLASQQMDSVVIKRPGPAS